jgi:hypothetical protein
MCVPLRLAGHTYERKGDMKTVGIGLFLVGLVIAGAYLSYQIVGYYGWKNTVYSYWTLSDRSSTLAAKETNITSRVGALGDLSGSAALIFKTPQNDCQNNIAAVKTLQSRLTELEGMDESSFQYQTAIQQITAKLLLGMESNRGGWNVASSNNHHRINAACHNCRLRLR